VQQPVAPDFHFASLISSADGNELYGIDVRDTTWTSVGLVRLSAITGEVLARRTLTKDVWFIDLATVPREIVPSGPMEATTNSVNPPINGVRVKYYFTSPNTRRNIKGRPFWSKVWVLGSTPTERNALTMDSKKYIGMDMHKESISIAVMNGAGKIVMECVIETKASMILQFIDGLRGDLQVTFKEGPAKMKKIEE
jgi:hypothetical protein